MDTDVLDRALNVFGKRVVDKAKSNLTKGKKNNSKKLYNSLKFVVSNGEIAFYMESYGDEVDAGRHGTQKKVSSKSIFQPAKAGFPKLTAIKKWVQTKPVKFTGTNKRVSVDSMAFVIGRSIERKGIKASLFFTNAYLPRLKELPDKLITALAHDIENKLKKDLNI